MLGWYRKLTLSCVSFTIYKQCHLDIEVDVTPATLQYQNVQWVQNIKMGAMHPATILGNVFGNISI